MQGFISRKLNQVKHQPSYLQQRLLNASPANKIKRNLLYCEQLKTQLSSAQQRLLMLKRESFAHQCEQLHIVSPLATIARGYSITRTEQGDMIKSIKDITIESNIKVEVSDGVIDAKVIAVKAS